MKAWSDLDVSEKFEVIDLFIANYNVAVDVDCAAIALLLDGWDINTIVDRLNRLRATGNDDFIPF